MKRFAYILLTAIAALLISGCNGSKLPRAKGSAALDAALEAYIQEAKDSSLAINSIIVIQDGKVVEEAYVNGWTKSKPHQMWSTTKTFTAMAVGFAIQEGLLTLDTKFADLFPEEIGEVLDTLKDEVQRERILSGTIKDYLVMGAGHDEDVIMHFAEKYDCGEGLDDTGASYDKALAENNASIIKEFYDTPFNWNPGEHNFYDNEGSHMLSCAVQKVTGQKILDYLQPRLFKPLNINVTFWDELQGCNSGGWGLFLKPEDMAKFGLCMMQDGKFGGKQILPADFLAEGRQRYFSWGPPSYASEAEGRSYMQGYGFQMWMVPDAFMTSGFGGQFIIVMPQYNTVISCSAELYEGNDHKEAALIWKHFIPVIKAEYSRKTSGNSIDLERVYDPEMDVALNNYVAEAKKNNVPIQSVMVLQHGKVLGERYVNGWQKDSTHHMWSTSKTFTAFAVGYAIEEGLLHLDDKIVDIFPEETAAVLDTLQNAEYASNMRKGAIKDYLVMATGQFPDPTFPVMINLVKKCQEAGIMVDDMGACAYADSIGYNMVQEFFKVPFVMEPGENFCYNSVASFILSAAVQKVSGQKTMDYLYPRLFKPLGVERPECMEVNGINTGGWGMFLDTEAMAKVGQCMMNGGKYAGRQVIPADYLEEARTPYHYWGASSHTALKDARYSPQGYGYQTQINDDSYFAAGAQGQFIFALPQFDAVIVGMAEIQDDDGKEPDLMWRHLLPVLASRYMPNIYLKDFGLTPESPENAKEKIAAALDYIKGLGCGATFKFEPGDYDFTEPGYLFHLNGMQNVTIDGCGSRFFFHKLAGVADVKNCTNLTFRDFETDWRRPYITQATITGTRKGSFDLSIDADKYPYVVKNGIVKYLFEGGTLGVDIHSYNNIFTPDGSIRPGTADNYYLSEVLNGKAEVLPNGSIRFFGDLPEEARPGDQMAIYNVRYKESIVIAEWCKYLRFEDINVHAAVGCAFLVQCSEGVKFHRVNFKQSEGRVFTAIADAFHVNQCKGHISMIGCSVDGQGDDALNTHGKYLNVEKVSGRKLVANNRSSIQMLAAGDEVAFVSQDRGEQEFICRVKDVKFIGRKLFITLDRKVPACVKPDTWSLENISRTPRLTVRGCNFGPANRARGILITTPKKAVVEYCHFKSSGAAILVEGDQSYWYESGAVGKLLIRDNVFENCHQNQFWGLGTICFSPSFNDPEYKYHNGVRISGNKFIGGQGPQLYLHNVGENRIYDNEGIEETIIN